MEQAGLSSSSLEMILRKLSDSDKQQILKLYRLPGETTSTLASRFGVSNSTVSRILKTSLSEVDYEALIQQKRGARTNSDAVAVEPEVEAEIEPEVELETEPEVEPEAEVELETEPEVEAEVEAEVELETEPEVEPEAAIAPDLEEAQLEMPLIVAVKSAVEAPRRSRRRSGAPEASAPTPAAPAPAAPAPEETTPAPAAAVETAAPTPLPTPPKIAPPKVTPKLAASTKPDSVAPAETSMLKEMLREDLLNQEDLEADFEEDDEDDLDEDDLDEDFDDEEGEGADPALLLGSRGTSKLLIQVLPMSEAPIPKTCYLVVDRSSELIARPLQEFGDLGQIPETEISERTLPVFDNHRVAKRFSNPRTQRVIKLPDGRVLQKTSSHLHAKGITRLLIDGQIYSLKPEDR